MPEKEPKGIREICADLGIELVGEEGKPYHCDQKMRVKVGMIGPDYAECKACGLTIGDIRSPHINGGYEFTDDFYEKYPDGAWVVLERR